MMTSSNYRQKMCSYMNYWYCKFHSNSNNNNNTNNNNNNDNDNNNNSDNNNNNNNNNSIKVPTLQPGTFAS